MKKFALIGLLLLPLASCAFVDSVSSSNEPSSSSSSSEEAKQRSFVCDYVYGYASSEDGVSSAIACWDSGTFSLDLPCVSSFLVPGDHLTISYYGDLTAQETLPSVYILDGELAGCSYSTASLFHLGEDSFVRNEDGGIESILNWCSFDLYVILNEAREYVPLGEYKGEELWISFDSSRPVDDALGMHPGGALFAFNPR